MQGGFGKVHSGNVVALTRDRRNKRTSVCVDNKCVLIISRLEICAYICVYSQLHSLKTFFLVSVTKQQANDSKINQHMFCSSYFS